MNETTVENTIKPVLLDFSGFKEGDNVFKDGLNIVLPEERSSDQVHLLLPGFLSPDKIEEKRQDIISNIQMRYGFTPEIIIDGEKVIELENVVDETVKKSSEVLLDECYLIGGSYWVPILAKNYIPINAGLNFKIDIDPNMNFLALEKMSKSDPNGYNIQFDGVGESNIGIEDIGPNIKFYRSDIKMKNKICINFGNIAVNDDIKNKIINNIKNLVDKKKQAGVEIEVIEVIVFG